MKAIKDQNRFCPTLCFSYFLKQDKLQFLDEVSVQEGGNESRMSVFVYVLLTPERSLSNCLIMQKKLTVAFWVFIFLAAALWSVLQIGHSSLKLQGLGPSAAAYYESGLFLIHYSSSKTA